MKLLVMIPVTIALSVALLGITKLRKKEQDKEDKRIRFLDIKLRVTYDVLKEYQTERSDMQLQLDKSQSSQKVLQDEAKALQSKADKAKGDAEACQGTQVGRK